VQFELLVVSSVEDAITAVALNGEIQAAIIRHDLPLRFRDRLPLMTTLLGTKSLPVATDLTHDWIECGEWIKELRPHIDLYLLTDESIGVLTDEGPNIYDHTSTSPNQQLLASLDLARRQVDIEGFQLIRYAYNMSLVFRHRVRVDPVISKWFRILDEADLVPGEFRASEVRSYRQVSKGALEGWNEAWKRQRVPPRRHQLLR
jgi:hypothetical protein